MRLGDLDALKAYVKHTDLTAKEKVALLFAIAEQPTIDAVPVSQLEAMLSNLERSCRGGDEGETYTTGYRNGHHNGQIELLRYILQAPDGTSEDERKDGEG